MKMNIIEDINGNYHIPMQNIFNSYCWMITGIQRLICSKSLKELINKSNLNDKYLSILTPINILNKLSPNNIKEIENQLKNYFESNTTLYKSINGFSTNLYLSKYIFPLVYYLSNNSNEMLVQIMKEIGLNSSNIYFANDIITENKIPIFELAEEKEFYEKYYEKFISFMDYLKENPFKCNQFCSLELELWSFTEDGHIIPIIQDKNHEWVVFDDHRFVGNIIEYLSQPYNFYKVKFSLTDESFKQYIIKNINNIKLNHFEINESLCYLTLTKKTNQKINYPMNMAGGNASFNKYNNKENNREKYINLCIFSLYLILLVILLVIIINICNINMKNHTKEYIHK